MIAVIWVLGSLLLGATVGVIALYARNNTLSYRMSAAMRTAESLRGDRDYYVRQTDNYQRRYMRAVDGLTAVQNLRTGKMANIGHRMYQAATTARNAALSEPFDKS